MHAKVCHSFKTNIKNISENFLHLTKQNMLQIISMYLSLQILNKQILKFFNEQIMEDVNT